MMFNIQEDNKDIDSIISHLESLVVQLRRSQKLDDTTIRLIKDLFDNEILQYMTDYYTPGIEVNSKHEEQIMNSIIDMIITLKKIT